MSRPARPWFRFYVESFGDQKLLRLTPAQRWLWVAVLGAARGSCEPGRLLIAPGEAMTASELARFADVPVEDVWPALEQMARYGMVELGEDDGLITVCNWSARQFESDNVTVRTAKTRSKERSEEQPNDVRGNTPDTETETETDRESTSCGKRATRPDQRFTIDAALTRWASEKAPGVDLERERDAWLDWCAANGKSFVDHRAAFQTWCRRAHGFSAPDAKPGGPVTAVRVRAGVTERFMPGAGWIAEAVS